MSFVLVSSHFWWWEVVSLWWMALISSSVTWCVDTDCWNKQEFRIRRALENPSVFVGLQ